MDELQYLFSMPAEMFPPIPRDPKKSDYKMMQYMTKLVTNFATTEYNLKYKYIILNLILYSMQLSNTH